MTIEKKQRKTYYKIKRTWNEAHPEKVRASRKAWNIRNPDKVKAQKQVWRKRNKLKLKLQAKIYHQTNKETIKLRKKIWYQANKEKIQASQKTYYEANKEKTRIWKKANLEKVRDYNRKRRALKHTTQIEPINEKIVYFRDGGICQHCRKRINKKLEWPHPMSASLDHIVPLSEGGAHIYKNLQLAHLGCNLSKKVAILPQGEQLRMF